MAPSYYQGFAPRDYEPAFPSLWKGVLYAYNPELGPTGATLYDWGPRRAHGTLTNLTLDTAWLQRRGAPERGNWCIEGNGSTSYVACETSANFAGGSITIAGWHGRSTWFSGTVYTPLFDFGLSATVGIGLYLTSQAATNDWAAMSILGMGDGYNTGRGPRVGSAATTTLTGQKGTLAYSGLGAGMHHLAIRLGPAHADCFLNGVPLPGSLSITGSVPSLSAKAVRLMGPTDGRGGANSEGLHGPVAMWDRILSAQEIMTLSLRPGIMYEPRITRRKPGSAATGNRRRRVICGASG